jgi:tryptophan synthase alpha chain
MTKRIDATFVRLASEGRRALVPFIMAADPSLAKTVPLMHTLVASGANIIELGVPFSDPMADGPVIQRAALRALAQDACLSQILDLVEQFRLQDKDTPVVLMGYANPIESYGADNFVRDAAKVGVDGVLVVDYPIEEGTVFAEKVKAAQMDAIFLLAPTSTPERFVQVSQYGSGYVYYVSLRGVTGAHHIDYGQVGERIPQVRAAVGLPVAVGFGIRDAQSAARMARVADAVVIGSALVEIVESTAEAELMPRVQRWLQEVRFAMDDISESEVI